MYQLHMKIPGIKPKPLQTRPCDGISQCIRKAIVNRIPSFEAVSKSQRLRTILRTEWVNTSVVLHKHKSTIGKLHKQHTTAHADKAMYQKNVKWQQICTELLKKFKSHMVRVIVREFRRNQVNNAPVQGPAPFTASSLSHSERV
jgi:hypothetical protein